MHETLAQALVRARRSHALLTAADWVGSVTSAEEAYAVQEQVAQAMGWFGDALPKHWKSGGNSREVTLTHAGLPPEGVRASPADLRDFPFFERAFEGEIALRLGQDVTPAQAAKLSKQGNNTAMLVDAMAVSIEMVDWRWQEQVQAPALLRTADVQSNGGLVLGPWLPYAELDWTQQTCRASINGQEVRSGTGTHALGTPGWLLPCWLRHCTRHGATVPAGTVVTTGTWIGLVAAKVGDLVRVAFDGIGEAQVQL
jgi:2-keto-4-pentenoate hydratase